MFSLYFTYQQPYTERIHTKHQQKFQRFAKNSWLTAWDLKPQPDQVLVILGGQESVWSLQQWRGVGEVLFGGSVLSLFQRQQSNNLFMRLLEGKAPSCSNLRIKRRPPLFCRSGSVSWRNRNRLPPPPSPPFIPPLPMFRTDQIFCSQFT